jgi:tetratricopeptide (TPR) repeat protein
MTERILVPGLLFALIAAASAAGDEALERDLALHRDFLSSPELADQRPGRPAHAVAARYVVEELRRAGFAGGLRGGAFLLRRPLPFTPDAKDCILALRTRGGTHTFAAGADYRPLPDGGTGEVVGPVVFVEGRDGITPALKGRIVLLVEPAIVSTAVSKGALGVLLARDPRREAPDRVTLVDGTVLSGRVTDRGTEFLLTDGETGEARRLTKDEVREIEFSVPAEPPGVSGGEPRSTKPLAVPVLGVSGRAAQRILGQALSEVLARIGAVGGAKTIAGSAGTLRILVPKEGREVARLSVVARYAGWERRLARQPITVVAEGRAVAVALAAAGSLGREKRGPRPVDFELRIGEADPGKLEVKREGDLASQPFDLSEPVAAAEELLGVMAAFQTVPTPTPEKPAPPDPKPPTVEGTLQAARRARFSKQFDRAEREIAKALAAKPEDGDLLTEKARILLARGRIDEALSVANTLASRKAKDGREDLIRSEIARARGRAEEADRSLESAASRDLPEAVVLWAGRMPLSVLLRHLPAGVRLRRVVRQEGKTALGAVAEGLLALISGRPAAAETRFSLAVERDPLLGIAWYGRGLARSRKEEDPLAAARDFDTAEKLGFRIPSLLFERGLCRLRVKMFTLAIRDFRTYLSEVPRDAAAIYNIACAHALMRNTDEALDWLARAIEAGFDDVDHMRSDPDLEFLRGHPRFEGLLRSKRTD